MIPRAWRGLGYGVALALGLLVALASPARAALPIGDWLTQGRDGVIRIGPCGADLCGWIVGIGHFEADGSAPRAVGGRSQCQLAILTGLHQEDAGVWQGTVTDPRDGTSYHARVTLDPEGRLHMRGYVGIPLFGETQIWTRYAGRLTQDCHMR